MSIFIFLLKLKLLYRLYIKCAINPKFDGHNKIIVSDYCLRCQREFQTQTTSI